MLRCAFAVAFIFGLLVGARGQEARVAEPNKAPSLQPILEALDKAKLSGSLVFSGRCDLRECKPFRPTSECFPDFPQFRARATSEGSPLQTLREIFADDPAMQVMQESDGTIRMIETGVPTDLLNIRIRDIVFEGYGHSAVYNPNAALNFILSAPEVVAFMKLHDIGWPFAGEAAPGNPGAWPPDLPHISGSLDNVTLSEALDRVLKTFPGVWVYENCPRSDKKNRVVYFRFFHLRKIGSGVPLVDE